MPIVHKKELIRMLGHRNIEWLELSDACGRSILISPSLGGRILGVFPGGVNLLWVNENFSSDWNCGGHRTWIAPEWQEKSFYLKPDRCSWFVDSRLDPGKYRVTRHEQNVMVEMSSDFDMNSVDGTRYLFSLTRKVALVPFEHMQKQNPLYTEDTGTMKSVCVSFEHCLQNNAERPLQQELGLWSILQVNPPGLVLVPVNDYSGKIFHEYYESFPEDRLIRFTGGAAIFVDGLKRYKLGCQPDCTRGAIGYVSRLCSGVYGAVIKLFSNVPHGRYIDKPKGDKRKNGDVIQMYNHFEGGAMAFAELECHAPAITLASGEQQSFGIDMFFMSGEKEEIIDRVAAMLFSGRTAELLIAWNKFFT